MYLRHAFLQLWRIYQLRPYLDERSLATITHTLVTTRLDYCNALYVGQPLKMVRQVQLPQNQAVRLMVAPPRRWLTVVIFACFLAMFLGHFGSMAVHDAPQFPGKEASVDELLQFYNEAQQYLNSINRPRDISPIDESKQSMLSKPGGILATV
ncbi:uncharacterized protein LOC140708079 [Pogona vitticeps]